MDICDRVLGDAANGAQQSAQALIKRLAHRNANVQLYTLEVSRLPARLRLQRDARCSKLTFGT